MKESDNEEINALQFCLWVVAVLREAQRQGDWSKIEVLSRHVDEMLEAENVHTFKELTMAEKKYKVVVGFAVIPNDAPLVHGNGAVYEHADYAHLLAIEEAALAHYDKLGEFLSAFNETVMNMGWDQAELEGFADSSVKEKTKNTAKKGKERGKGRGKDK